ncbi:type III pantothenate kinase [Dissulfurirhabdus thermomarina]|uniref:Type III pantothenate kinase n=1 Tax=Dissulfurirhabdus thermomarina TaxID=1765737 RepID=A0A6N9TQR7_DISTH|nr:type III pantothenate kinase [Dissulfurirhabdus thermomarina]NDY43408.1 type III pantothenate kinase [Dissulfurirhabdus thermomarina]NMX23314.1 type III pantothenate kinase [Dissulfurirhabdus thermomarina]
MEKVTPPDRLLAVDVGNTHTVIGLFEAGRLLARWRLPTRQDDTADALAAGLVPLFRLAGHGFGAGAALILACVVPPVRRAWEDFARRHLGREALAVDAETPVGMPIRYRRPHEVGADRLVNAVAAYQIFGDALIVVDYGTATTFDCVSPRGEYLGGAIAPGVLSAAEGLFRRTARLPKVDVTKVPAIALAQDTASALQAGMGYGFAGLTAGIIQKLEEEFEARPRVVATGGLAEVMAPLCPRIERVIPHLTLLGLAVIYGRLTGDADFEAAASRGA